MSRRRLRAATAGALVVTAGAACGDNGPWAPREPAGVVIRGRDAPEEYLADTRGRSDTARLHHRPPLFDTDEDAQSDSLPPLPAGMTEALLRRGDAVFHGAGGCLACHGAEATGLGGRGSSLTTGLHIIPADDWRAIDSLVSVGVAEEITRSPIGMPPRGVRSDLSVEEVRAVAAYVWAIAQTRGEPWVGGHASHASHDANASARTLIP